MVKTKKKSIVKKDIINEIFIKLGITSSYSKKLYEDTINIIISILKKKKIVKIVNFGTFKVLEKKERIGRNPKSKELFKISSRKTVSFKTSPLLKKKNENTA